MRLLKPQLGQDMETYGHISEKKMPTSLASLTALFLPQWQKLALNWSFISFASHKETPQLFLVHTAFPFLPLSPSIFWILASC